MSRWQIIIIGALGSIAWILYKRFIKKETSGSDLYYPPQPDVENWYGDAQDMISVADEQEIQKREAAWEDLTRKEKIAFSDDFILNRFGQRAITGYNIKQRLQIGEAHYLIRTDQ
jgi:hypothetical protein